MYVLIKGELGYDGKTHIAAGIATAAMLTISEPTNLGASLAAVAGGALGGIYPDVDIESNDDCTDARDGRILAIGIAIIALLIDFFANAGIVQSIMQSPMELIVSGCIGVIVMNIIGCRCEHRGFTHSILAMILLSASVGLICEKIMFFFEAGYLSHLMLDILNKKPIRLFFPFGKKGICLGCCYANKTGNMVFLLLGVVGSVMFLIYPWLEYGVMFE